MKHKPLGQPDCTIQLRRQFINGPLDGYLTWRLADASPVVSFQSERTVQPGWHTYIEHTNIGLIYAGVMAGPSGDVLCVSL